MTNKFTDVKFGKHEYPTILDAAQGLLCEVVSILNPLNIQYAVMGGWCPYLRCQKNGILHPGTKDVDILFPSDILETKGEELTNQFLGVGYYISAKHDFQLFRILAVKEKEITKKVVFNVDFMHPTETLKKSDRLSEHSVRIFEFDLIENNILSMKKMFKSISLPSAKCVFSKQLYGDFDLSGTLPDGKTYTGKFSLVDEAGLILTKLISMQNPKRPRDAFDLYIIVKHYKAVAKLQSLCNCFSDLKEIFQKSIQYLDNSSTSEIFNKNVKDFFESCNNRNLPDSSPAKIVKEYFSNITQS